MRATSGRSLVLSTLLAIGAFGATASGVEPLRTVALSGTQTPGGSPGELFGTFINPATIGAPPIALNNLGEVAFVQGNFYSEGGGTGLKLIARHDDFAPDTPSGVAFYNLISVTRLLDDGTSYFSAQIRGPGIQGTQDIGVWMSNPSQGLANLFRGQMTSDAAFDRFDFSLRTVVNQQGQFSTTALLGGPGVTSHNNHSIWTGFDRQSLAIVAREGDIAPGLTADNFFGNGGQPAPAEEAFDLPQINRNGTIAFYSGASGPSGGDGIWSTRGHAPGNVVVLEGQPALGLGQDFVFQGFGNYAQSDSDLIAFGATVSGPGVTSSNDFGLWRETSRGTSELIVRDGQTIAVNGESLTISQLGDPSSSLTPGLNSQGVLTFAARLSGPGVNDSNNSTLWRHDPDGGFRLIAREGSAAPGTEDGTVFGRYTIDHFRSYVLNKGGQVAFAASLRGPEVTDANGYGIWATDLTGNLQLVVREGDTIDVNDGDGLPDLRVISRLSFAGPASTEMGLSSYFNDRGQIAFTARFTDGSSGVFVTDLVMIPEPGTAVLGITAAAIVGAWLRMRRGVNYRSMV